MLQQFQNHWAKNFPFLKESKLLLAVSAGLDSMVLLHLFQQLKHEVVILHCNFQLRGLESLGDQQFIQDYAKQNKIPFSFVQFDTEAFAKKHKLATQLAARTLRYDWFYEQLETQKADYILTAHHADDNLETFLINLARGTGLDGLTGIPAQNKAVIRPLLPFSRNDIEAYAKENKLNWREDSSNASDKYLRNKIRHHLVPLFKELNPSFINSFKKTQNHLQEAQELLETSSESLYKQLAKETENQIVFEVEKLLQLPNYKFYLHQWLKKFGFTAWNDIYNLLTAQSGKQVFAPQFRLLKNRGFLIISPIKSEAEKHEFLIEKHELNVNFPLNLSFSKASRSEEVSNTTIFVDADKLQFPLCLRLWQQGDVFQPLGMNGKSKKVSKLLKDEKMALIDKEKIWLLCSNNQIVWVVGLRQDNRFKTDVKTTNSLKIELK